MTQYSPQAPARATFSLVSILAIVAAIASFFVGAGWGFLLAVVAIIFGAIGALIAIAPGVRGGFTSIFSVFLGVVGIIAAIVRFLI